MQKLLKIAGIVLAVLTMLSVCGQVFAEPSKPSDGEPVVKTDVSSDKGDQDFLASLEQAEKAPAEEKEAPVYVTALSFIFKLALVLVLAYGTVYALKRFTNFKSAVGAAHGNIRVLEHSQLGANKTLHLVAVGGKRLLVASTASQVNLVAELDPEDVQEIEANLPTNPGFKDQLSLFLGNKPDTNESAKTVAQMLRESSSYLQNKVREVGFIRRTFKDV